MTAPITLPENLDFALFDFDGVIADTEPLYVELDRQAIRHFGYDPTDEEVLSFVGHPSEILAPELLAKHGISITTEQYLEVWDADGMIYGSPDLEPSPGLPELWNELAARGTKIGVVSTTPCSSLVRALNHFQLLSLVSVIVGRELVSERKPNPEPYRTALSYLAPARRTPSSGRLPWRTRARESPRRARRESGPFSTWARRARTAAPARRPGPTPSRQAWRTSRSRCGSASTRTPRHGHSNRSQSVNGLFFSLNGHSK